MIGYVAKDEDGKVYLYTEKPTFNIDYEAWFSNGDMFNITETFPEFNDMSYTDEPVKVEINIKRL